MLNNLDRDETIQKRGTGDFFSFFFSIATASFQEGVKWPLFCVICYLFYCIVNKHAKGDRLLLNGYLELNRI